jgi:type IV pilus assembly protein PilV
VEGPGIRDQGPGTKDQGLRTARSPAPRSLISGFTLLEALIALLVLSIGLLGLAALQARGLRFNHDAYVRSQASLLAYDLFERMRANSAAAANYVGEAPGVDCGAGSSIAENDRACWHTEVAQTLPGGTANVTLAGNVFTVAINWTDRDTNWTDRDTGAPISQGWSSIIN